MCTENEELLRQIRLIAFQYKQGHIGPIFAIMAILELLNI